MSSDDVPITFDALRPRLLLLLELHRLAGTDAERAAAVKAVEAAFLATAFHVAQDMAANGWPASAVVPARRATRRHLRVVGGTDC